MAIWRKGRKEKRINWIPQNYLLASCFQCFILTFLVTKCSEEKPPRRYRGFLGGLAVKSLSAGAGAVRDVSSIPGPGRSPEEGVAAHSSTLAWRTPQTEGPGRPWSVGSRSWP